jgi:hypothetical protein
MSGCMDRKPVVMIFEYNRYALPLCTGRYESPPLRFLKTTRCTLSTVCSNGFDPAEDDPIAYLWWMPNAVFETALSQSGFRKGSK